MKKNYSSFLLKILLLTFLSILLVSCNKKSTDEIQITIWHQMRVDEREILQRQLDRFMKLHPKIKVNQIYKETEELRSGFIVAAIGGQGPELIYGPQDQVGPFEIMNIILPLDTIFSQEFLSQFNEKGLIWSNNHLWMIADKLGNHLALVYNKKLVKIPPKTDRELIEIGKQLTKDFNNDGKPDQYGLVWNYTEPFFFIPFLTGFGGWVFDEKNNPSLNTEAMIKGLKFIADLRDKHKIIPGEADYDIADVLFKEGKAGMIINGDWSWASYGKAGIDYGIAPLPLMEETGLYAAPMISGKGYSINANVKPEKLQAIKLLLEYLLSPEQQLETAKELNTFPTHKSVYNDPFIKENEILINSQRQIELGKPMPIISEMRAVWDAMRPYYQAVLGGAMKPEIAAQKMQEEAVKKIQEMNEDVTSNYAELIFILAFVAAIIVVLILSRKTIVAFIKDLSKNSFAYYLVLPAFVVMILVIIYPFFYNIVLSFSNMNLRHINDWSIIGLNQYIKVFSEPIFYTVFLKTIIWTVVNVFFHVTIGVTLALLLNRKIPGKTIFRTLLILPWAIPQYIVALTWRGMFNYEYGAINLILTKYLSLPPVEWLKSPLEAFIAVIITNVWLGFPFMMVIALGALQSIPNELYEAAEIEGANWFHKLWKITIPLIKPVMIPAITLGIIWTFNNLNVVWLVSNAGEPSDQTHILVSYVYKAAFNLYRYGYAAAFSMVIFFILLVMSLSFLKRTKATETVY
jgi:arabinogalactan oligomer/maltooligosaccharide transport system permease protein